MCRCTNSPEPPPPPTHLPRVEMQHSYSQHLKGSCIFLHECHPNVEPVRYLKMWNVTVHSSNRLYLFSYRPSCKSHGSRGSSKAPVQAVLFHLSVYSMQEVSLKYLISLRNVLCVLVFRCFIRQYGVFLTLY